MVGKLIQRAFQSYMTPLQILRDLIGNQPPFQQTLRCYRAGQVIHGIFMIVHGYFGGRSALLTTHLDLLSPSSFIFVSTPFRQFQTGLGLINKFIILRYTRTCMALIYCSFSTSQSIFEHPFVSYIQFLSQIIEHSSKFSISSSRMASLPPTCEFIIAQMCISRLYLGTLSCYGAQELLFRDDHHLFMYYDPDLYFTLLFYCVRRLSKPYVGEGLTSCTSSRGRFGELALEHTFSCNRDHILFIYLEINTFLISHVPLDSLGE